MKQAPKLEILPIDTLTPYENNARTHSDDQIKKIQASLREFGFVNPVLIDANRGVIAGHGRIEAAKREGMTEVPCVFVEHLTDAQKRAYILADNRLAELAGWDMDAVRIEIERLAEDGFGIEITGFEFDDIPMGKIAEDDFDADAAAEETIEPITEPGDIWQLGRHRLMCGDSTDRATMDRLMDGQKADMLLTDPPYGVDYKGINNDDRKGLRDLLDSAFENMKEQTKDGGVVYCFHSDKSADIFHEIFRKHCHFSSMIIWKKPSLVLSQGDYQSIHEPCLYGWFDNGTHEFYGDRKQTSVWECGRESVEGHTTPKPKTHRR